MKILVTGGCGFIGSHFIELLLQDDAIESIINIDKLTYATNLNILPFWQEKPAKLANYAPMGIENDFIPTIIKTHSPDVIVNFAANTHVDRSIRYPREFIETDVMGVFNLAYACIKAEGRVKRFIHISTDEVYGPWSGDVEPFDEGGNLNPTSPYSASKAAADLLLMSYFKTYNLPVMIVRPCNNYGPRQYPEKLIPMAIIKLLKGEKVPIHGKGGEVREWIYVKDCCERILEVIKRGIHGQIYNIGSAERYQNMSVIYAVWNMLGLHRPLDSCIDFVPNRPGNDRMYAIDSRKFWKLKSHTNETDFHYGIEQTIQWYKDHIESYDNVNIDSNIYSGGDYLR